MFPILFRGAGAAARAQECAGPALLLRPRPGLRTACWDERSGRHVAIPGVRSPEVTRRCLRSTVSTADQRWVPRVPGPDGEAESFKEQGNAYYAKKDYHEAYNYYTKAIDMRPKNASYYGNRAATLMMLGRFREALADAQQSVRLDDGFVRGHLREGKCHLSLGNAMAACRSFQRALELDHRNTQAQQEFKNANAVMEYEKIAETDFEKRDFRKVVFCMDRALEFAPACHRFKILKAECLAMLGRYPEAQSVASDILRLDSTNADALYVRGLCLYYEDCIEKAVQFFVQALRMAPDHEKACVACRNAKALKAKKEDGNKAFKDGNYKLAHELYTEALAIDPNNIKTNAKLYCNRGTVNSKGLPSSGRVRSFGGFRRSAPSHVAGVASVAEEARAPPSPAVRSCGHSQQAEAQAPIQLCRADLRKLDEAIGDCTRAVTLDDSYIKAYLRRAQCYMDLEQYEEAVRDYEKVYQTEKTKEHKQLLKNAQLELKKSKRKDYYKILGVDKNASEDEIKRAYRKRALMHHPDRHSGASAEVQKEEEKKFKEVGEAFTILSDPKKKTRYDSGQDLDEEGMNMGDFDANNIFKAFFGGPGGFSFEASGPGNFFFQFG
ncbi:DnaJ like protein subfamily C member 7 [Fukomys damarensis]|uniref:DnaJ homolog subfamily C member 7 n=1 Tax=Fukomys damarensis TaxID=885580 RepID=A0A091DBR5_FUKDA|nr:DnaJ like protein subfamily C member 7 [Fukomys damarensis]